MRNSKFLSESFRTLLQLLPYVCAQKVDGNVVIRPWHNLPLHEGGRDVVCEEYAQYRHGLMLGEQSCRTPVSHSEGIWNQMRKRR